MTRLLILLLCVFSLGPSLLASGTPEEESPILALDQTPEHVGGFIGLGGLWQSGSFGVNCNCNLFTQGAGSAFSLGALYENHTKSELYWGVQAGFVYTSLDARYLVTEDTTLQSIDGKTSFRNIPVSFRNTSHVTISALSVHPYVKWMPLKPRVFLRMGVNASLIVSATKDFHKILLSSAVTLPNDDVVSIRLDRAAIEAAGYTLTGDNEVILQDGSMADHSSLVLNLTPALGYEMKVSKSMFLVPVVQYSYGLGALSTLDTDFRENYFQFLIEVHYAF